MPANSLRDRPPAASPYASHLPSLDRLRGLAVLGVIASHVFPGNASGPFTKLLRYTFGFGSAGVDLFFVLSGFLITGILFDTLQDRHFFQKFYARRILRIFPLYYGLLALYALGAAVLGRHYNNELLSLWLFLQNTGLVARPIYAYAGPAGAALALLLRSPHPDAVLKSMRWCCPLGFTLTAFLLVNEQATTSPSALWVAWRLSLRYSTMAALFTGMLALCLQQGIFSRFCKLAVLRRLGTYSYDFTCCT